MQPSNLSGISVIIPIKNEEATIDQLLRGLFAQTYQPSEIVITDAGSTDRTRGIIRDSQASAPAPIVLVETEEALPGRARNLAIERATHDWIACIDGGIYPHSDWLGRLVTTAENAPQAEIIYGVVRPLTNSYFTECAAITYLPGGEVTQSIASCLMRRSAWQKAGRFREDLRSGEDLLFFEGLDAAGVRAVKCADAIVDWELQPTVGGTFHRFVTYSHNGMKAGLARQWQSSVSRQWVVMLILGLAALWFWPLLFVPLAILFLRSEKRIWAWYRTHAPGRIWRELLNPRRILVVTIINLVIDAATFYGMWRWFLDERLRSKKIKDKAIQLEP